jgi:hypothetical protein
MRLIIKDIIKLTICALILLYAKYSINSGAFDTILQENYKLYINEVINILPFFSIICLGFYAALQISLNIASINDCEKEYQELITELDNEEKKLKSLKLID